MHVSFRFVTWAALAVGLLMTGLAHASVVMDYVPVGSPGNAPSSIGLGAVASTFYIGKYEVTNAQYVDFLNAADPGGANTLALYNPLMTSDIRGAINRDVALPVGSRYSLKTADRANQPIAMVSWYDTLRFVNWLNNGQGAASTETGAYTLLGGTPTPSNSSSIVRNPGATVFLPSENEWYKSAYFDPNKPGGAGYWQYPTCTDVVPYSAAPPGFSAPDITNSANVFRNDNIANGYNNGRAISGNIPYNDVGAYRFTRSPFGTFDQAGNVTEWSERTRSVLADVFGGSYDDTGGLQSNQLVGSFYSTESFSLGFRIATVPEPASVGLVFGATIVELSLRRVRGRRH